MAANTLGVNQVKEFLNNVTAQATGAADLSAFEGENFATVAQIALNTGYENLLSSVSQVLSKTVFATRPYTRKFQGLEADSIRFGNIVRKVNFIDGEFEDNQSIPLEDGQSVDQYTIHKPKVLQLNYYGQNDYQTSLPIFRDQLLTAFNSEEELGSFVSGTVQNISDRIEQKHETLARAILANLATGVKEIANAPQQVHLLSEYNAQTGSELTDQTMYAPQNFPAFMRWCYARIASTSAMLTERTILYHQNVTGKAISRHTPAEYQRLYMYTPTMYEAEANSLALTYKDSPLFTPKVTERVNFWQSVKSPAKISAKPVYLAADGTLKNADAAVEIDNLFAILTDVDAAGYTICNYRTTTTPFNAAGEYTKTFWKFTDRYWNDFTENTVIFTLD